MYDRNRKNDFSFDGLPRTVAELHAKIDRLTAMFERFISSAETKPEIMTVEDIAAMLCKSVSTIYAMTSDHRIPYRKQGNKLYFLRSEINAWLSASVVPKDTPKRKRKPHENGKLMKHCLHRNVLRKQIPSRTIRVRCKPCRKTMPKTALQFWSKNKEMPLTLSSKGYTQGTEQYFSLYCSQMTSRPPERENSSKLHVNFTAIGATSGAAVTSSTLGRRLGICKTIIGKEKADLISPRQAILKMMI